MIFPTVEFIIFFIMFLAIWSQLSTIDSKVIALCVFNVVFYGFYNLVMLGYLVGWVAILYYFSHHLKWAKFAVIFAVYQIVFWKLVDAKLINGLMTPLGISFFTFQGLTYIFGILKKPDHLYQYHIDKPWGMMRIFAFVGFFPTVFSGPILRARQWEDSLVHPIVQDNRVLHQALTLIALGCLYKLCFSSILHEYVLEAYSSPAEQSSGILLGGMYSYCLEIFHDFAGYSLMSMGIALLMGFYIPDNFNCPYFSRSIKEFWQRWHISLSTWLRDYLYFFLGGSYNNRQLVNIAVVMTLSGLWHGLSLNYILWGLMHTLAIICYHQYGTYKESQYPLPLALDNSLAYHTAIESRLRDNNAPKGLRFIYEKSKKLGYRIFCIAFVFHYISLTWIFFRSPDATTAFEYLGGLLKMDFSYADFDKGLYILMFICLVFQKYQHEIIKISDRSSFVYSRTSYFVIFWTFIFWLILALSPAGMPPFIYFTY